MNCTTERMLTPADLKMQTGKYSVQYERTNCQKERRTKQDYNCNSQTVRAPKRGPRPNQNVSYDVIRQRKKKQFHNQATPSVCIIVKNYPIIHPEEPKRPFHGLGCSCLPYSERGLVTPVTTKLGLRNLLLVPTSNSSHYYLTRKCCYIFYCWRLNVNFTYPKLTDKAILQDNRVQEAVKTVVTEELEESSLYLKVYSTKYDSLVGRHLRRAGKTLKEMKAALSCTMIRITGYVLFKVFSFLFMSVTITEGQLQIIEAAAKKNVPLVFVPLHRSHVDYLFVTWVLFNRQIPAPIVAAGDNLRMPVFGWLLRSLGGFFIKRKLENTKCRKDYVYRALLQTYMSQALRTGYNLEFFIEGGRTRTGKPCLPKGGLLSVIVDAYLNGTLEDALIVPIAINYDKLLDGNFIREQMGQNKVPESFWRAVTAIIKVFSTSFGHSRIDFSHPFSLNEYFRASKLFLPRQTSSPVVQESITPPSECSSEDSPKGHKRSYSSSPSTRRSSVPLPNTKSSGCLHTTRSSSSLFGTEVTEDYRQFVRSLALHIVYDAESSQAIMSTNAVSWLLSYLYRDGTTLDNLARSVDHLKEDLRLRKRDTGFSGDSINAAIHAVKLLGSSLVQVTGDLDGDTREVFVRPVTALPNVIELNYYASALAPVYSVDAIVTTALVTLVDCDIWSYVDMDTDCSIPVSKLVDRAKRLCEILQNEFLFIPPCGNLESRIHESVDRLTLSGLLINEAASIPNCWSKSKYEHSSDEDSDESGVGVDTNYTICPKSSNLEVVRMLTRALSPLIDSYYATVCSLKSLIRSPTPDKDFVHHTQKVITTMLRRGTLLYGESIAADPIRNALKFLEVEHVLESYTQDSIKLLFLSGNYDSEDSLLPLIREIESFRI